MGDTFSWEEIQLEGAGAVSPMVSDSFDREVGILRW